MAEKPFHPSFQRLLDSAYDLGLVLREEIASALGESSYTVNNWASRGVSKAGAMKAEEKIGISAVWILKGKNQPTTTVEPAQPATETIADPLKAMAALYDMIPPDQRRDAVAAATKAMAAFIVHQSPTAVNHENPASSQDVPEFSHAATRNKAA